jgi:hypothetical protein
MPSNAATKRRQADRAKARRMQTDRSLQVLLWALWTLAVIATGYRTWQAELLLLALVVDCLVVGIVGLVVMTVIEFQLQPWRFLD